MPAKKNENLKCSERTNYVIEQTLIDNWDKLPEDAKTRETDREIDGFEVPNYKERLQKYMKKHYISESEEKGNRIVHDGIKSYIRTPVVYNYSQKRKTDGRMFADSGLSLQSFPRRVKQTISGEYYVDIDMVNAHPNILNQYCLKKGWDNEALNYSVEHNEEQLNELMNEKKISRGDAKRIKIKVIYGKKGLTSKLSWFKKFTENIEKIHSLMLKDVENRKIIKQLLLDQMDGSNDINKVYNVEGRLCSYILNGIENDILQSYRQYLATKKIDNSDLVLSFDGFMLPIENFEKLKEVGSIDELSNYGNEITGYKMKLKIKPFDEKIDLSMFELSIPKQIINYINIESDKEVCDIVLNSPMLKKSIISCNGGIFIKTLEDKIWTDNKLEVKRFITQVILSHNFIKTDNKGCTKIFYQNLREIDNVLELILRCCPVDNDFMVTIAKSSSGKLFFKDCVYEFSTGKTRIEKEDEITQIRIMREFPRIIDQDAKKVIYNILSSIYDKTINDNKISATTENILRHCARTLASHITDKKFVISHGLRNCGKGIFTEMCLNAFPKYVSVMDANCFIETKKIGSIDTAMEKKWLIPHMWTRMLMANEVDEGSDGSIVWNGGMMKALHSGGDIITARTLNKTQVEFVFGGRLFLFSNSIPTIKPVDTLEKVALFHLPNQYIDPLKYDRMKKEGSLEIYMRRGNPHLGDLLKEQKYIDAFMSIVLDSYTKEEQEDTLEIQEDVADFRKESGDIFMFYKEKFDFSDKSAYIPSVEVLEIMKQYEPTITAHKIKSYLVGNMRLIFKQKKIDGSNVKVYCGIKLKSQENDNL